jgi:hypothetical protein
VFLLDFKDETTRDEYVGHARHKKFIEEDLAPFIETVMVVDFPVKVQAHK